MRKWLPYAPVDTPGVWWRVTQMIPTRGGAYYPNNIFVSRTAVAALAAPGTTLRAWCALLPDDTAVRYIGTTTKLWSYDGVTTFTDISKGGGYTNTATDWSLAQFGNYSLGSNRVDAVQVRDAVGGGNFADCAGTPAKARIICTQSDAVLLADLNDGAEKGDAFAACAPGDHTDWSGTGATTPTRIRHRPGRITAMTPFADYVLAFKQSSVYKLTYTGVTNKWKVQLIAIGRGAWGKHDVVNCGDHVVFSGPGGAWRFDGSSFRPITDFVGEIPQAQASFFSPITQNVHFYMASRIYSTTLGVDYADTAEFYTYNLVSDEWGNENAYGVTHAVNGPTAGNVYVPMTGEPAALRAVVAPTAALPDLMWMVDVKATNQVMKNSTYWGGGNGAGSAGAAGVIGGVDGIGGDVITNFSRLTPELTMSLRSLGSDPAPGNTELFLNATLANSIDAYTMTAGYGSSQTITSLASSSVQKHFDFQKAAVYGRFEIYLPQNSGYIEITDYRLDSGPGGTL